MNGLAGPLSPSARPPRRLRTQLLIAFAVVAMAALLAGGSTVAWLMLRYRAQLVVQRLGDAARGANGAAFMLERQGAAPDVIATAVASQLPLPAAHVLVLDSSDVVVAESVASGGTQPALFTGHHLDVPLPTGTPVARSPFSGDGFTTFPADRILGSFPEGRVLVWRSSATAPGAADYVFVTVPQSPDRPPESGPRGRVAAGSVGRGQAPADTLPPRGQPAPVTHHVVLAIPVQSLPSAWHELAPGFAAAALAALLAAALAAWWLAGSIARPIRAVTQATERVARGEPHRPIPETGGEEVVALARGFNTMAREVERSQGALRDFVANASHELRTPLTAIQGFSQAVTDGVLDAPEPTVEAARLIQHEAERMRRLVEDLLLLSRVEARDRGDLQATVDVAELIDALAQRTALIARERDLHLTLDLPERLLARGDANQLEHLFGNLIDNAVKYAPDGATVTVHGVAVPGEPAQAPRSSGGARRGAARAGRIQVTVHNTGSYIPPDSLPHIFERFYRVEKSRSRDVGGSGLGLAIVHEIVERHGGTIRVESDPETGTAFVVTLPAAAEPAKAAPVIAGKQARPHPEGSRRPAAAAVAGTPAHRS